MQTRRVRVYVVGCVLVTLWFAGLVLIVRALAGALVQPLPALMVLLVGALAVVAIHGARLLLPWGEHCGPLTAQRIDYSLRAGLVMLAIGLSLPGGSSIGLCGLWGAVAAGELYALSHKPKADAPRPQAATPFRSPRRNRPGVRFDPPQMPAPHLPAEDVVQQLVRRTTAAGGERLEGYLRVRFEPNQQHAVSHVAFCPAFEQSPEIETEQVDGPPAKIKLGPAMPHGVRIECSLVDLSNLPQRVLVSIVATLI